MRAASAPPPAAAYPRLFGIFELFSLWRRRQRNREELEALDAHMLADIGMTRDALGAGRPEPHWFC